MIFFAKHAAHRRRSLLLSALGLVGILALPSCRHFKEDMDSAWLALDPVGHHRYHREKYYPNEKRMGLRLPRSMEED